MNVLLIFFILPNLLIQNIMYILASSLFEKDDKYVLKLEIRVVCREFFAFKYIYIVFSKQIR